MTARIHTFRGVPAVTLSGGDYRATFLPELGMLGTSLRWRDHELLSLHGGLDGWRAGHTTGMPLLAPWANRLGRSRFKVGRKQLDLADARGVHEDANGSPIHGLLLGSHGWTVDRVEDDGDRAQLATSFAFDEHPHLLNLFPFPQRLEVEVTVDRDGSSWKLQSLRRAVRRCPCHSDGTRTSGSLASRVVTSSSGFRPDSVWR